MKLTQIHKQNNFQKFLHNKIPLTAQMGLEITKYTDNRINVFAPLKENINDKGSVFGGSSSALMIITAWSLIKMNCLEFEIKSDIVIHKNSTDWHKALYSDLIIIAEFKHDYDFQKIKKTINNRRHQRIACTILLKDKDANIFSTMTANYVIIPK